MAQAIHTLIPNFVRWVADNTAGTLTLQVWNSGTAAWDTVLTLNALTTSEQLTIAKLLNLSGGATDSTLAWASLGAATTTASTALVSSGLGVSVTPAGTQVRVRGVYIVSNNTAGDGVQVAVYRSTAGIPAAGAAPAAGDVSVYSSGPLLSSAANQQQAGGFELLQTGLTAGTKYYFYIAFAAVTGGTASLAGGSSQTALSAQGA